MSLNIEQTVAEIEQLHQTIDGKTSLMAHIKAGHLLIAIKESDTVKHGQFKKWVRDNFETVSYPSANRYMRLAQHEELIKDCETVTEALDKIAKFRAEEKKQAKGEDTTTTGEGDICAAKALCA